MSYSQNNEESEILKYFGDQINGRLLDIGAYDGATFSNSLALFERGWTGVCVEPSPGPFIGLLKRHGQNPDIKIVQAAITENDRQDPWLTFYDSGGDAISTSDPAHKAKWEAGYGSKFTPFHLLAVTMEQLLKRFGTDFDFINLDVEGKNFELFRKLPLDEPRLRLICVEHDLHYVEMTEIAARFGFKQLAINGENLLLAK